MVNHFYSHPHIFGLSCAGHTYVRTLRMIAQPHNTG